jgi:hypothetical protein
MGDALFVIALSGLLYSKASRVAPLQPIKAALTGKVTVVVLDRWKALPVLLHVPPCGSQRSTLVLAERTAESTATHHGSSVGLRYEGG